MIIGFGIALLAIGCAYLGAVVWENKRRARAVEVRFTTAANVGDVAELVGASLLRGQTPAATAQGTVSVIQDAYEGVVSLTATPHGACTLVRVSLSEEGASINAIDGYLTWRDQLLTDLGSEEHPTPR